MDEKTIELRFKLDLQNLDTYFSLYDEVNIIDTTFSEGVKHLLILKDKQIQFLDPDIPI